MNLVEALLKANNESRDFLRELEDCERLAPGLYDVCIRDGEATVTWWPREAAA